MLLSTPLSGLGCGLVYAATLTITCQYFDKRRGLALGVVTTGTAAPLSAPNSLVAHHFSSLPLSCMSCWEPWQAEVNTFRGAEADRALCRVGTDTSDQYADESQTFDGKTSKGGRKLPCNIRWSVNNKLNEF